MTWQDKEIEASEDLGSLSCTERISVTRAQLARLKPNRCQCPYPEASWRHSLALSSHENGEQVYWRLGEDVLYTVVSTSADLSTTQIQDAQGVVFEVRTTDLCDESWNEP